MRWPENAKKWIAAMRDQDFFWEGVDRGQLLVQCCIACGHLRHPPGPMCPQCLSLDWQPREVGGAGTVSTFMVSRHPTQPDDNPRIVVLVDLAEGIRMVSNLVDIDIDEVHTGLPVSVVYREVNGETLPQFRPRELGA